MVWQQQVITRTNLDSSLMCLGGIYEGAMSYATFLYNEFMIYNFEITTASHKGQ